MSDAAAKGARPRYSRAQLLALRKSPLSRGPPPGLPSLEAIRRREGGRASEALVEEEEGPGAKHALVPEFLRKGNSKISLTGTRRLSLTKKGEGASTSGSTPERRISVERPGQRGGVQDMGWDSGARSGARGVERVRGRSNEGDWRSQFNRTRADPPRGGGGGGGRDRLGRNIPSSSSSRYGGGGGRYREELPEWATDGPEDMNDMIELHGFQGEEAARRNETPQHGPASQNEKDSLSSLLTQMTVGADTPPKPQNEDDFFSMIASGQPQGPEPVQEEAVAGSRFSRFFSSDQDAQPPQQPKPDPEPAAHPKNGSSLMRLFDNKASSDTQTGTASASKGAPPGFVDPAIAAVPSSAPAPSASRGPAAAGPAGAPGADERSNFLNLLGKAGLGGGAPPNPHNPTSPTTALAGSSGGSGGRASGAPTPSQGVDRPAGARVNLMKYFGDGGGPGQPPPPLQQQQHHQQPQQQQHMQQLPPQPQQAPENPLAAIRKALGNSKPAAASPDPLAALHAQMQAHPPPPLGGNPPPPRSDGPHTSDRATRSFMPTSVIGKLKPGVRTTLPTQPMPMPPMPLHHNPMMFPPGINNGQRPPMPPAGMMGPPPPQGMPGFPQVGPRPPMFMGGASPRPQDWQQQQQQQYHQHQHPHSQQHPPRPRPPFYHAGGPPPPHGMPGMPGMGSPGMHMPMGPPPPHQQPPYPSAPPSASKLMQWFGGAPPMQQPMGAPPALPQGIKPQTLDDIEG